MELVRDVLLIAALVVYLVNHLNWPSRDDTDPPGGHSGMVIVTDAKTGKQYLLGPMGGITPRLD